jgi:hypothetical protein
LFLFISALIKVVLGMRVVVHALLSTCLFAWSHFKYSTTGLYHIHMTDPSMNRSLENEFVSGGPSLVRETLTKAGKLGLRLLEDLTALAAGGSVCAGLELVHCVPNWIFFLSGLMIIGS